MDGRRAPRVVVCGLGPATAELVTVATTEAIARTPHRFLRTSRHPSAPAVGEAVTFDGLYDTAASFDEVYDGIVAALVEAATDHGEVLYAVPGSPAVAESSVERLRADGRVEVEVLPSLSFVDLVWDRLGIDPLDAGVRLVDGHRFATEAAGERGPLLVAQCDNRDVLSEVKLALADADLAAVPPAPRDARSPGPTGAGAGAGDGDGPARDPAAREPLTVTVLQRLGLPDERIVTLPWSELDREIEPDHLTSVFVPRLAAPVAGEVAAFAAVVQRLRRECPWDREQDHHSLRRHLLEEAYEVLEAIDHLDVEAGEGFDELEEELGDLLFQVVFHATLAAEEGRFTLADVARGIRDKLVHRHPHVFGDVEAETAAEVAATWEQNKMVEKGRANVMEGIPATLPALLYALKVQKRARSEGVDWRDLRDPGVEDLDPVAGRLLELVDEAGAAGVDPESALRIAAEGIRDRFVSRPGRSAGP